MRLWYGRGNPLGSPAAARLRWPLAWTLPAAGAKVSPFTDSAALEQVTGNERRVWSQGDEMAQALARGGVIYESEATTAYVQGVLDRLFPEFKGHMQVAVLKSAQLNAFALPNGRIYINQGLLARFHNEAQLATLLATKAPTSPTGTASRATRASRTVRRSAPWPAWWCRSCRSSSR